MEKVNEAASGVAGVRWGWMRLMYGLNVLLAGVPGLVVLFGPESALSSVPQDRLYFGVLGSIWLTVGVLSIFGLRRPLRFAAIFAVQIVYKSLWLAFVLVPLVLSGEFRADAAILTVIFVLAIAVCLIATPYAYLFGREAAGEADVRTL